MKLKVMKRIGTFLLVGAMVLGMSVPAFAAEIDKDKSEQPTGTMVAEYTIDSTEDEVVPLYDNDPVGSTIPSNGSAIYKPSLSSYIGLSKTFYASTASDSTSGMVLLYLYNANGKLISNDWVLGVNDYGSWSFTLPSSGIYTLKVYVQGTTAPVHFGASWEG